MVAPPADESIPVENTLEIVLLGVGEILAGCLVIGRRDIIHDVVDVGLHLVGINIDQTRRYLASGGVLQVFQLEGRHVALMVAVDHASGAPLLV